MQTYRNEEMEIKKIKTDGDEVSLIETDGLYTISRFSSRSGVTTNVSQYTVIDSNGKETIRNIDKESGLLLLDRISKNQGNYNSSFYFNEYDESKYKIPEKSKEEHSYTSTGIKFWRHSEQMWNYRLENPNTIISTHISPEGACNLKCPYCSVTHRDTHSRLDMNTIKDYVLKLKTRGLKAVILTGGGEPTGYKHFNELVRWLNSEGLSVALITNGTLTKRIEDDVWKMFSWIRVSINVFDKWVKNIKLPLEKIDQEKTTLGCSMVFTVEHQSSEDTNLSRLELFKKVSRVADQCGAKYIRLLPNCLLEQKELIAQHKSLDGVLSQLEDTRYFHQYKIHGAPNEATCHQSYFRPYLSEEIHKETDKPGTVYPCDSVVLNDNYQHFAEEFQLCHASDILDYLDHKIQQKFDARQSCKGCVFTENVNMLGDFKNGKIDRFSEFLEPLKHEEFV